MPTTHTSSGSSSEVDAARDAKDADIGDMMILPFAPHHTSISRQMTPFIFKRRGSRAHRILVAVTIRFDASLPSHDIKAR